MVAIEIRRAAERGRTQTEWTDTWHSFSYGGYYDSDNLGFGVLQACNEDRLAAGHGYDRHRHSDVEIVTWMLDGQLVHTDNADGHEVLTAGMAQHLGAGSGVAHGEHARPDGPAHYIQMWVRPSVPGLEPVYAVHDFSAQLDAGDWVPVASGTPDSEAPLRLRQLDAELLAIRLAAGSTVTVPVADLTYLQVTHGSIDLDGRTLDEGDVARLTDTAPLPTTAATSAEVLVWRMYR